MPLQIESEVFPPSGGTAAVGVLNQLGRPSSDRMMLLIREAVQNSWDARTLGDGPVKFHAAGYVLSDEAKKRLLDEVFAEDAPQLALRDKLVKAEQIQILALSDFGTVGLGGPTRGDVAVAAGVPTHFVDFLRNLGLPPDRVNSGGTYGFGKAAYYLASALQTICVYSRYSVDGETHSRFMAAGLGAQFESEPPTPRKHTGRHWWGRMCDEIAEPVTGTEADDLNRLMGGPERGDDQTGTTVFILMPQFEQLKPEQAMERIGHVLLHYFWPKLIDGSNGTATMCFSTSWQGDDIPFPKPEQAPGLPLMMRAFRAAVSGQAEPTIGRVNDIQSQRPKRQLGRIGFVKAFGGATTDQTAADSVDDGEGLPNPKLRGPIHHVALMRAPNFVVRYLETAASSYDGMDYAGVFIADAGLDGAFASAEPPTHDDWVYNLLTDSSNRSFVKNSIARIKEAAKAFAAPVAQDAPPHVSAPMVEFSRLLGGLIPAVEPPGSQGGGRVAPDAARGLSDGGGVEGAGGRPGGGMRARVEVHGKATLVHYQGVPATRVEFLLKGATDSKATVTADARIVTPDGFESEPPQGAALPRVLAWLSCDGSVLQERGERCLLEIKDQTFSVVVGMPDDAVVSLSLDVGDEQ